MISGQSKFSEADKLYSNAMQMLSTGDPSGAATLLEEITVRYDNYGKAWCELGNLLQYRLNDLEGAVNCYRKAIEVTPAYAPSYLGYADALFAQEKFAEENAILNQAMEISGIRKDLVLYKSALLMESQGRYDEAIGSYKDAILVSFSEEEITKCEKGINRCNIKKKYQ
ncbi:MAG: tetratricopeptide repeat protein [Bacteroidota bacterium]|nr:tetratricopeptide repeat protein [Bacteroidota bacterium]